MGQLLVVGNGRIVDLDWDFIAHFIISIDLVVILMVGIVVNECLPHLVDYFYIGQDRN
jgi:hypothetical protein